MWSTDLYFGCWGSPSKRQAERWAESVESGIRLGSLLPSLEADRHTLDEAIDRYLEEHLDDLRSEKSQRGRRYQLQWWSRELGPLGCSIRWPQLCFSPTALSSTCSIP